MFNREFNQAVTALRGVVSRAVALARNPDAESVASGSAQANRSGSIGAADTDVTTAAADNGGTVHLAIFDLDVFDDPNAVFDLG